MYIKWKWKSLSCIQLFATQWTNTVHRILQARILEVGSCSLLQGIFPTQVSNPGLLHCRWILPQLSHQGSPIMYVTDHQVFPPKTAYIQREKGTGEERMLQNVSVCMFTKQRTNVHDRESGLEYWSVLCPIFFLIFATVYLKLSFRKF